MGFEAVAKAAFTMSAFAFAAIAPAQSSQRAAFEATLAAHDSATEALSTWCEARGIARPAQIVARPVSGTPAKPPKGLRRLLGVGPQEPLGYRHVELTCGGHMLSSAHNWYVPGRLTAEMNAALAASHIPFGKIAAPLALPARATGNSVQAPARLPGEYDFGAPGAVAAARWARAGLCS